jgi:hypothetical protein
MHDIPEYRATLTEEFVLPLVYLKSENLPSNFLLCLYTYLTPLILKGSKIFFENSFRDLLNL